MASYIYLLFWIGAFLELAHCQTPTPTPEPNLPNCTTYPCVIANFALERPLVIQMPVPVQLLFLKYADQTRYEITTCYNNVSVGPVTRGLYRRPVSEWTLLNKNTALAQSQFRWQSTFYPGHQSQWNTILINYGMDPNNRSEDPSTPVGLGNLIFTLVRNFTFTDGSNVLGDKEGLKYARLNFSDYTNFIPLNPPQTVISPDRWQPLLLQETTEINSRFYIRTQNYILPQLANIALTLLTRDQFNNITFDPQNDTYFDPTSKTNNQNGPSAAYVNKVNAMVATSAALTDYQKMVAEFFNNKVFSLGVIGGFAVNKYYPGSIDQYERFEFLANSAVVDTLAAAWKYKTIYNGIRPVSAIRFLDANATISSWGGPGQGTVQMKGKDWQSYLVTDAHPEYPSGTACVCAAFAAAANKFFNNDTLNFSYTFATGSSVIEPGVTPKAPVTITLSTFTELMTVCGNSRYWAGVHFPQSITQSQAKCYPAAILAFANYQKLINGTYF